MSKAAVLLLVAVRSTVCAGDFASLRADRTAIERVYYNHRLGDKPAFEQVSPPALIERLVKADLAKEAALKRVYGVEVTPGMVQAEVGRIEATTRAPETLAELKLALDNDTDRFARAVARPIVVERLLRDRFDNDDRLHAAIRGEAERIRSKLLDARTRNASVTNLLELLEREHANEVTETTWQLGERPPGNPGPETEAELEVKKRFGPNARVLSGARGGEPEHKFYFNDLPPDLQKVLRVQLRGAGEVSAVIEMPGGFALYLCKQKSPDILSTAALNLRKRSYEEWLAREGAQP